MERVDGWFGTNGDVDETAHASGRAQPLMRRVPRHLGSRERKGCMRDRFEFLSHSDRWFDFLRAIPLSFSLSANRHSDTYIRTCMYMFL